MAVDIAAILQLVTEGLALIKQASALAAAEKDTRRRKKLLKAIEEKDLETIREILFSVE